MIGKTKRGLGLSNFQKLGTALALGCLALASSAPLAQAVGQWTITLIKHNNKAADAYKAGDWGTARDEFRTAIGLNSSLPELYEGLMNTCLQSREWDQVAFAAEKLLHLQPTKQNTMAYAYGLALFHLNKDDEAIPWLKRALATVDQPEPPFTPQIKSEEDIDKEPAKETPASAVVTPTQVQPVQPVQPVATPREQVNPDKYVTSYENAIHSESIVLAKFLEYDKHADIHYNNPMETHYRIDKILKGPPLNPFLPIKYEFHDHVNNQVPKDWKFDEKTMMPAKGSQWILFIEFSIPKKGMFETFQGSYGRQPATEENLNNLYQLLDAHNMRLQQ